MKIICKNSCFFERICYNKVKSTSKEVTTMAFKITDDCIACGACEAECPKNESIANIARLNREFIKAKLAD